MFTGDVDYGSTSGMVTFDNSSTLNIITIIIHNDSVLEFDESFQVELISDTAGVILTTTFATVTIVDDDGEYQELLF